MKIENFKKHIVIDARLYGPVHTGIGRYVQNLLISLTKLPEFPKYRWTLLVYPQLLNQIKSDLKDNFYYHLTNIRHYSLQEQLVLPFIIYRLHPTLLHFPHFNKPLLYFGPSVVTIHDLIKNFSKGKETTARYQIFYWPKYWLYQLLSFIVIKTNYLIVPSNFWRQFILNNYHLNPSKIITTYEAVDPKFFIHKSYIINPKSYLLYVGNLYPHKNLQIVFTALKALPQLKLKIISKPSIFLNRTKKLIEQLGLIKQVELLGFIPDSKIGDYYRHALAYIFPSLMEGFGLPGLEAMSQSCPLISSNASCLPEIYGDAALYFNPNSSIDLIKKIEQLSASPALRQQLIDRGLTQIKKYSWSKTAQLTLEFYENILFPH